MPPVTRIKPRTVFDSDQCSTLGAISRWRGLACVAHAWLVILSTLIACTVWSHPILWLMAIPVLGGRQLGLAILMHDGAHGLLHPNRRINDFVARWFCGEPVGATLSSYRQVHFKHHKFTQQPEDPDLALSAPFPVTRSSLWRKVWRDLSGQTFLKQRLSLKADPLTSAGERTSTGQDEATRASQRFWLGHVVAFLAMVLLGWGVAFALWFIAIATWFQLAIRVRNIAEHACTATGPDPFSHARTTRAGFAARALVAPYWVNYHAEHHLFTWIPCYALPRAHRLLSAGGHLTKMTVAPGYLTVLKQVSSPAPN